ncbi:MAG: putative toxin-antitoxin system toxin component, PIN family [Trueperaceae bacterium]|nr:putative toxin-antitoxin system toxin component, PIN family [Trueperaceae bacterium]
MSDRFVFDTNVVVSALVFSGGRSTWLRRAWSAGVLVPVVSRATTSELLRVLAYPKFGLAPDDRAELLGDYLPFAETWAAEPPPASVRASDPNDQPFVDLWVASAAEAIVSGDPHLTALVPRVAVVRLVEVQGRFG